MLFVNQFHGNLSISAADIGTEKQHEELFTFIQEISPECKFIAVCIAGIAQQFTWHAPSALSLSPYVLLFRCIV